MTVADPVRDREPPCGPVVVVVRVPVAPAREVSVSRVAVAPAAFVALRVVVRPSSPLEESAVQVPVFPAPVVQVPLPLQPLSVLCAVPSVVTVRPPVPVAFDEVENVPSGSRVAVPTRDVFSPLGPVVELERVAVPLARSRVRAESCVTTLPLLPCTVVCPVRVPLSPWTSC